MKSKLLLFILCIVITACSSKETEIQKLQKQYIDVYSVPDTVESKYLCIDKNGNIHLIGNLTQSDIIVFYNHDIENALQREFTKADINRSSKPKNKDK